MSEYFWHDFVGNVGVLLILFCYLFLQLEKMTSDSLSYSILNGLGATMVLVSLSQEFNLSAFIIESAWVLISCFGIYKACTRQPRVNDNVDTTNGMSN